MLSLRIIDRVQTSKKIQNQVSRTRGKNILIRSRFELNSPLDDSKKDEDS